MTRQLNKLTDRTIKAAEADGQKRRKLADGGGLTLVIKPTSKVWWFRYRFAGKEKTYSLGSYPEVTLKMAREGRDEARKLLAENKDPVTYRRSEVTKTKESAENTFKAVSEHWLTLQEGQLSASTIEVTRRRLTNWIYPHLGSLPITDIEPPLVLQVLRKIEAKGKYETAHRMRQRISQIYRYAISEGLAERDPSADLRGILKSPGIKEPGGHNQTGRAWAPIEGHRRLFRPTNNMRSFTAGTDAVSPPRGTPKSRMAGNRP